MPTCTRFTRRSDNQMECLRDLDEKMCQDLQIETNPRTMSSFYTSVALTGISILTAASRKGDQSNEITPEMFKEWKERHPDFYNPEVFPVVEKYLVTDYKFEAWYQPR